MWRGKQKIKLNDLSRIQLRIQNDKKHWIQREKRERRWVFKKNHLLNKYIHVIICEEKFINRMDHPAKGQRPNTKFLETLLEKRKSNENFASKLSFFDWYFFYHTFLQIQGDQYGFKGLDFFVYERDHRSFKFDVPKWLNVWKH